MTILLATRNGGAYLEAQLDSLLRQTHPRWRVLAHDDGSSDTTVTILKRYARREPERFFLLEDGVVCGSALGNFAHLLEHCADDYVMFCDQDDVWRPDKIDLTVKKMLEAEKKHPEAPVLVHTDLEVVDRDLRTLDASFWHYSGLDPSRDGFSRLLMQNVVTGCTVMVNRALLEKALPVPAEAIMHDWWLGLVAARFGTIVPLPEPTVLYRQHGGNDTGAKRFGFSEIVKKAVRFFDKEELDRTLNGNKKQAAAFLKRFGTSLPEEEVRMLERFSELEKYGWWTRRKYLWNHRLLKQGWIRNMGLLARL